MARRSARIRIELTIKGGIAGIDRRVAVDSERLPAAERTMLEEHIRDCGVMERAWPWDVVGSLRGGGVDLVHYRLTVRDGGRKRSLSFTEADATEQLAGVVEVLLALPSN